MRKTDVLDTLEPLRAVCKDELAEYKVTELLDSLAQDSFDKIHPPATLVETHTGRH